MVQAPGWWWLPVVGCLAQGGLFVRVFLAWTRPDSEKVSGVPAWYWWLGLAGGVFLLCWGVLMRDIVLVVGQSFVALVYARNLSLVRRNVPEKNKCIS